MRCGVTARTCGGWTQKNLRRLLARVGPVGTAGLARHLGCSPDVMRKRGGILGPSAELFPVLDVVIAYRLLFGIYSGIVPDGIDDLVTDDIDWAGDATILLSYVKGRTAAENLTLSRRPVRLLERWLAHSALLRGHVGPRERRQLWLGLSAPGVTKATTGAIGRVAIQRWVARHGVTSDDGGPLKIHRSRIRTTHHATRDKSTWTGSAGPRSTRTTPRPSRATLPDRHHPVAAEGCRGHRRGRPARSVLRRSRPPTVVTGRSGEPSRR